MAHKQTLADTSASESNVKRFIRETTLRNLVEILKVEFDLVFFAVVRFITFLIISQVIVSNVIVKGYCQSIR